MEQLCTHPNVGAVLLVSLGAKASTANRWKRRSPTLAAREDAGDPARRRHAGHHRGGPRLGGGTGGAAGRPAEPFPCRSVKLVVAPSAAGRRDQRQSPATRRRVIAFDRLVAAGAACISRKRRTERLRGDQWPPARRPRSWRWNCAPASTRLPAITPRWATGPSRRERGRGADHHRGKVAGRLHEVGPVADQRDAETGRRAAEGGPLPAGRRPRRRGAFGFPNISDNAEIVEMMACGAQPDTVSSQAGVGRGIGPGPRDQDRRQSRHVSPPQRRHGRERGAGAGGEVTLDQVGQEIFDLVLAVAGRPADPVRGSGPPRIQS